MTFDADVSPTGNLLQGRLAGALRGGRSLAPFRTDGRRSSSPAISPE